MEQKELKRILIEHKKWLMGKGSSRADLRGADLSGADLSGADLSGADLRRADLRRADLRWADLRWADLRGADLSGADLRWADLRDMVYNHTTIGIHPAPEGELVVWGKKDGVLVKMLVPADAKRSCATSRKHRAEYVKVLEVIGAKEAVVENRFGTTVYRPGEVVRAHDWDDNRWNECAPGIHFFLTREEAEAW